MSLTINHKIRQGFSRSAKDYDRFSGLHREIADKLFEQVIREAVPSALLDVGCGTGYLTIKLKENFPAARIIGLDLAPGMIEVARSKHNSIDWVLADGNDLPFADGSFDILISNLAYQWTGGLVRSFKEARRVLVPDGILTGTLFGYNTCRELFQSLDEAKRGALQFIRLPDDSQVREALDLSGFKDFNVTSETLKAEFNGMQGLIAWLKSIGANNLSREGFVGPKAMAQAASIYRQQFPCHQGVGATFEVIRFHAQK